MKNSVVSNFPRSHISSDRVRSGYEISLNPLVHFNSVTSVLLTIYVVSFIQLEILCHNKKILLCVKGPAFLFVIWGKMGIFHVIELFSGRCMGNKSSIIKSLLSHTALLVLWEI